MQLAMSMMEWAKCSVVVWKENLAWKGLALRLADCCLAFQAAEEFMDEAVAFRRSGSLTGSSS
jgi:hypothetical protein